jgi:hypothetical protein
MAWSKSRGWSDVDAANKTNLGDEIRKFISRDTEMQRHPADDSEISTANINRLLQRVAGDSIQGIEIVIVELQTLRLRLTTETARVQREIADYAMLSQTAMQSTQIIAESTLALRNASRCEALRVG